MIDGRAMGVFGAFWRFWGETDPFTFFLPIFVDKILAQFGEGKSEGRVFVTGVVMDEINVNEPFDCDVRPFSRKNGLSWVAL